MHLLEFREEYESLLQHRDIHKNLLETEKQVRVALLEVLAEINKGFKQTDSQANLVVKFLLLMLQLRESYLKQEGILHEEFLWSVFLARLQEDTRSNSFMEPANILNQAR